MEIAYTFWEADDGWFVGYLNSYPDHLTQGHNLEELEIMLSDVYQIRQEEEKRLSEKRHFTYKGSCLKRQKLLKEIIKRSKTSYS